MTVFVDTSAFLAVLDADDANHNRVRPIWEDLITREVRLVCTNYILLETFALVQNRLGMDAVRTFQNDILPIVSVEWIDETTHRAGVSALLTANRRRLSLVDCTSFETMRRLGINRAFALDQHFVAQGFECLP
jgi:predicted nucleic acid-binding protein